MPIMLASKVGSGVPPSVAVGCGVGVVGAGVAWGDGVWVGAVGDWVDDVDGGAAVMIGP
jgi:hypothetical protein